MGKSFLTYNAGERFGVQTCRISEGARIVSGTRRNFIESAGVLAAAAAAGGLSEASGSPQQLDSLRSEPPKAPGIHA